MAQIAADAMEMPYDKITVLHGSTAYVKDGYGAYHSRSTVMGGSAILLAAEKLKDKAARGRSGTLSCCTETDVTLDGETLCMDRGNRLGRDLSKVRSKSRRNSSTRNILGPMALRRRMSRSIPGQVMSRSSTICRSKTSVA